MRHTFIVGRLDRSTSITRWIGVPDPHIFPGPWTLCATIRGIGANNPTAPQPRVASRSASSLLIARPESIDSAASRTPSWSDSTRSAT